MYIRAQPHRRQSANTRWPCMATRRIVAAIEAILGCTLLVLCGAFATVPAEPIESSPGKPVPHATQISVAQGFGTGDVVRRSQRQKGGFDVAPWTSVSVDVGSSVGWRKGPDVGKKLTVIPLGVDVAPIELTIVHAKLEPDPCDETLPWSWSIDLTPATARSFFDAKPLRGRRGDMPFEVAFVYPANPAAKALDPRHIPSNQLPPNATASTVFAAIDLHGHGAPDIVMLEYCCDHPTKRKDCDYTCTRTYERSHGQWRLIDSGSPC